ncbi:hypothetical protein HK097_006124 [Rhizophlyctis rosea]|uniref:Phosphoserine phosphatase n=1 Tax=Rhizophlyctis rosea TaxID=64517 RepID=A0AAD5SEB0_9FUNG|nr:hypothetical protein HK097_006124 [Rhizophlyctis rosea]
MFLKPYISSDAAAEGDDNLIEIVANGLTIEPGRWNILWRDDSVHGHDKSLAIKSARAKLHPHQPKIVFIGDGVSDLSAAREADYIFAKRGKDLEMWCQKEGLKYEAWDDFGVVLETVRRLNEEN